MVIDHGNKTLYSRIPDYLNGETVVTGSIECDQLIDAILDENHVVIVLLADMTVFDESHSRHSVTSLQTRLNSGLTSSILIWNAFPSKMPSFLSS